MRVFLGTLTRARLLLRTTLFHGYFLVRLTAREISRTLWTQGKACCFWRGKLSFSGMVSQRLGDGRRDRPTRETRAADLPWLRGTDIEC